MIYTLPMLGAMQVLPLAELIGFVDYWHVSYDGDGELALLQAELSNGVLLDRWVPVAEFIALDARFKEVLETLQVRKDNTVCGADVELAYLGWDKALLELPIAFMTERYKTDQQPPTFKVGSLGDSFRRLKDGSISLLAGFYIPCLLPSGTPCTASDIKDTITLSANWLEQHCPSWEQRFEVALAMGLDDALLPQYVFGALGLEPQVDLPSQIEPGGAQT